MIHNDWALRKSMKLPRTKIETDSFIAVQLLQQQKTLNFDSLRYMAETVEGSFSFTVLDGQDNLYFVKGDSPLCICRYPERGVYLYASTRAILLDALPYIPYPLGEAEQITISGGDLLMIDPAGNRQRSGFQFDDPFVFNWCSRWGWEYERPSRRAQDDYTRALKSVAGSFGISPDQIDRLLAEGFTHEEIEDYLYCGEV